MNLSVVHNFRMIGLPEAGKTLLARALTEILPKMISDEFKITNTSLEALLHRNLHETVGK
jgi:predicted ATPase with chaperone activity